MKPDEETIAEVDPVPKRDVRDATGYGPRALFVDVDGAVFPDYLICSGEIPSMLGGKPCPYSIAGRTPEPVPLDAAFPTYSVDKGAPGDLCPPCAKQKLGHLGYWQGHVGQRFPERLLPLRLLKCNQWFWLVVPDLLEDAPTTLQPSGS